MKQSDFSRIKRGFPFIKIRKKDMLDYKFLKKKEK